MNAANRLRHAIVMLLVLLQLQLWTCVTGAAEAEAPSPAPRPKTIYDDLLTHLFNANGPNEYNTNSMPICRVGDKLEVSQDMLLYQLFDLDEPTQMLSVDVWVESTWQDCRFHWDPAAFNGVTEFAIKSEKIWYPDLIFYESLHGNFEEGMFIYGESTARVRHDGWVKLGAQALFKAFCRVDISRFPYDSQRCNITFSSWTKDARTFRLTRKSDDTGSAQDHAFAEASNGEWEVTGFPSYSQEKARKIGVLENETAVYTEVVFQLRLKRKYLFHQTYMLFPCLLLSWLAAFAFFLPTECGERVAYVTTILLSLVVFLLLVADNIPRSGDCVPVLGVYFCLSVLLVSLSTLMVIASYNVSLKPDDFCPPEWLRRGCFRLGPLVGFRPAHHSGQLKVLSFRLNPRKPAARRAASEDRDGAGEGVELQPPARQDAAVSVGNNGGTGKMSPETGIADPPVPGKPGNANTWRYLGIVMDRLFFVVYFCLNLCATIWIMGVGGN